MDKVSVIVPIYNAEKYLENCIESLLRQTYENIEIVLVNDGSTDNSKKICEKYLANDSRIQLINTMNQGAGRARQIGVQKATERNFAFG